MKSIKNRIIIIVSTMLTIVLFAIYTFLIATELSGENRTLFLWLGNITFSFIILTTIVIWFTLRSHRVNISRSFNTYVESQVSQLGIGIIVINTNNQIVWVSDFIEERFSANLIGKKLIDFSDNFTVHYAEGKQRFSFSEETLVYEVVVDSIENTIIIKDITNEATTIKQFGNERVVIGELEIDNFQQYQVILPEEELFAIQSKMVDILDKLVDNHNLVYHQYVNGKYIIITNQETLIELQSKSFSFLNAFRNAKIVDDISLSASFGIGAGTSSNSKLLKLAKRGLLEAQARGGDQISVAFNNDRPIYYGSRSEIAKVVSKVKIKHIAETFENKLKSENIKNMVIFGHKFADLDAVGSALLVAEIAKAYDIKPVIQNTTFDKTTEKELAKMSKEAKELFTKPSKVKELITSKNTIIVIVDTAEAERIETNNVFDTAVSENTFVFDHHRISSISKNISAANTYIDASASSAVEIISEVAQFITKRINPPKEVAQMALNGIFLDTQQFNKSVSSRTFQASAWLESFGASSLKASASLKPSEEATKLITQIIAHVYEIKPGYYMSYYDGEVPSDVISMAADEILRTSGRKAAFVIAKVPNSKEFKLSARGIETNVQTIAEAVGGGGHFSASAATTKEPLSVFVENVRQAIIDQRDD